MEISQRKQTKKKPIYIRESTVGGTQPPHPPTRKKHKSFWKNPFSPCRKVLSCVTDRLENNLTNIYECYNFIRVYECYTTTLFIKGIVFEILIVAGCQAMNGKGDC